MKKITPAQSRMMDRAKAREVNGRNAIESINSLQEVSKKYGKPFEGVTSLHGSADFRVARNLEDMGLGRVCTRCGFDQTFFILGAQQEEEPAPAPGENIKAHLEDQVKAAQDKVESYSCTLEESKAANDQLGEFLEDPTSMDQEAARAMLDKVGKYQAQQLVDRLQESLALNLAHVKTRYLITDAPLISPSGFHTSDLVFIVTDVFIQTDRLPRQLSGNLKAFDMAKLAAH